MPALKEIGNLANRVGVSTLSQSPIWNKPVESITSAQLYAFVTRMSDIGQRDEAETAIELAMDEITKAISRHEINVPPMLSYFRPTAVYLTAGELKKGLHYLEQPRAGAVLFGLETGMDATGVAMLTHRRLVEFKRDHHMSAIAQECLNLSPRHLKSPYVFWRERGDGQPFPLFGLDAAVFDAFGLIWSELVLGYENLIMVDYDADRKSIECFLHR